MIIKKFIYITNSHFFEIHLVGFKCSFKVNAIVYDKETAKMVSDDFKEISKDISPLDYETVEAREGKDH